MKKNNDVVHAKATVCTSIFKSGAMTTERYTQKWIELINLLAKTRA